MIKRRIIPNKNIAQDGFLLQRIKVNHLVHFKRWAIDIYLSIKLIINLHVLVPHSKLLYKTMACNREVLIEWQSTYHFNFPYTHASLSLTFMTCTSMWPYDLHSNFPIIPLNLNNLSILNTLYLSYSSSFSYCLQLIK